MKYANLYWQQSPDFSYDIHRRIREGIDLAVESEQLGFHHAWFAEQHFHNYGYSPNPVMIAQAVASRTTTLRVGMSVLVLPLWNPIRLAEDLALLDGFCGGRLDVGIGRGYQNIGFDGFNVDRDARQGIFEEALQVILDSWTKDELFFEGTHFNYPHGMNVLPKPLQKPYPPIWYAVTSSDNVRYVAKTDYYVFGSANWANLEQARRDRDLYLSERAAAGFTDDRWTYALNRQCYVIPPDADWKSERENFERRARYSIRVARSMRYDTAVYNKGELEEHPLEHEETTDELFERILFGYPEQVAEQVLHAHAEIPIDMLILQMDFGGLDHRASRLSQELFGTQVIPIIEAETGGSFE